MITDYLELSIIRTRTRALAWWERALEGTRKSSENRGTDNRGKKNLAIGDALVIDERGDDHEPEQQLDKKRNEGKRAIDEANEETHKKQQMGRGE